MNKFTQVIAVLYLALCSACALFSQAPSPVSTLQGQADAELLFLAGDFDAALTEFARISQTAVTAEERNQALYGLACTQIMVARTSEQLTKAIGNLQRWDEEKGNMTTFSENRRLLIYALKHQGDFLAKQHREQALQEKKKNSVIVSQRQRISEMAETVGRLEKQLDELEAIDEKFQEKRKAL